MCECVHCVTVYGQRKPPSPFVFVHVCILFRSIEMRTKALDDNFCMKLLWPFECTAAYNNLARESRKRLGIMLLAGGTFRRKLFKPVIELSLEIASVSYCRQLLLRLFFAIMGSSKGLLILAPTSTTTIMIIIPLSPKWNFSVCLPLIDASCVTVYCFKLTASDPPTSVTRVFGCVCVVRRRNRDFETDL